MAIPSVSKITEDLQSSPVPTFELSEFIVWVKHERPGYAEIFDEADQELAGPSISTDIIQTLGTFEDWQRILSKPGIGLQLAKNVGK